MITLDAKTDYSFMRGFGKPAQWLARADELGASVLGVADYCSTWGHVPFRDALKKTPVRLLYGVQLPVVLILEKDPRHALVTIIAKDNEGLKALYALVTTAHKQKYYRPRVTWKQVRELHGLCEVIVNDASISDLPAIRTVKGAYIAARPRNDAMLHFVRDSGLPVVATTAPAYPSVSEREGFELVQAISNNHRIGEVAAGTHHWLRGTEYVSQMQAIGLEVAEEWTQNLAAIADACRAEMSAATPIKLEGDLEQLAREGAVVKGIDLSADAYGSRLARELHVIREKKFESYFLFVHDLVKWSKSHMLVGPGRGSSGGSLLCYLLGITAVDPLRHGTLFERFIDITRPDWPDIDIDFPDARRDLVFGYLKETYGEGRVARLGTISEFGGKSAINDTAKATGVDYSIAREVGKFTEGHVQGAVIPLKRVFDEFADQIVEKHPSLRLAETIENHARHHGVHAAGVVVNNEDVINWGSVDSAGVICMDMKSAENIGMIKMDALGLKTLSVIQDACDQVGIDPTKLWELDLADEKVYRTIFQNNHVTGVFQFEGHAVRQLMQQVHVDQFDDLCALTSLARPGPLMGGAAAEWCDRRRDAAEWEYFHPLLERHTKSTYGTIVYQEQAMAIVRDLGAFTEPEVNGFRRAMGKKDPEKLATYREKFVAECAANFIGPHCTPDKHTMAHCHHYLSIGTAEQKAAALEKANELWDQMCEFGSYAFNYSHAVAYSMISYAAAWLKCYHPLEFSLAQLRCSDDEDRTKQLLREITEEGHAFTAFDPHRSDKTWAIIDGRLFGGFDSVRGVGHKTAALLLAKRQADPENFLDKLTTAQREKLTRANCTPWHSLSYFGQRYAALYADPSEYRKGWNLGRGVRGPVLRIRDIPPVKGNYAFLGRITRRVRRDLNDAAGLAKRDGRAETRNTHFINIYVEDDTEEIGMTINRWKAPQFEWLLEEQLEGRDFFIRGDIINEDDGRRWLFVENILEVKE